MSVIIPAILSGGPGTRLWPLSSNSLPKQFLRIFGERTLFQMTLARFEPEQAARAIVICNEAHESLVAAQAEEIGHGMPLVVLEPVRRDSAAAIAAAAVIAEAEHGADAIVVAVPSDSLIRDTAEYRRMIAAAARVAAEGAIVTLGVTPDGPATEFGYIERGDAIGQEAEAFKVKRFTEKPHRQLAETYVETGRFLWNAGVFVFAARSMLEELERYAPAVLASVRAAVSKGMRCGQVIRLDPEAFSTSPKTSIDYAVMENTTHAAVVPVCFDWSDVGNWRAVAEAVGGDSSRNVLVGDVRVLEGNNVVSFASNLPVRIMGLSDIAVIACADGVLVAPIERCTEIKTLVT